MFADGLRCEALRSSKLKNFEEEVSKLSGEKSVYTSFSQLMVSINFLTFYLRSGGQYFVSAPIVTRALGESVFCRSSNSALAALANTKTYFKS